MKPPMQPPSVFASGMLIFMAAIGPARALSPFERNRQEVDPRGLPPVLIQPVTSAVLSVELMSANDRLPAVAGTDRLVTGHNPGQVSTLLTRPAISQRSRSSTLGRPLRPYRLPPA